MRRAQTTLEYVCLIGLAAAAVISMLVYASRSMQGRLRVNADQMGEQFSPGNMTTSLTQTQNVSFDEDTREGLAETSTSNRTTVTTTTGTEGVSILRNERF